MVSVIIATYNGEKYIAEQLRSVFLQTTPADEVLIFDDCSSDGTVETLKIFIKENNCEHWSVAVNDRNKGYCKNFLEACKKASGDIIFLCDQDDVWYSQKIEKMISVMDSHAEISALCCSCECIDGNGAKIPTPQNIGTVFDGDDGSIEYFTPERFVGRSFIRGCSVCFRKELMRYIEPLELKGLLSHDWLITFTATLTKKCAVYNKVLMSYRCHGNNNSFGERQYGQRALAKRIEALEYSIVGHTFILENADRYNNMTERIIKALKKHISFEKLRISYLKNGGFKPLLSCLFSLYRYKCYYGSAKSAVKVFTGDILYRKKRKTP